MKKIIDAYNHGRERGENNEPRETDAFFDSAIARAALRFGRHQGERRYKLGQEQNDALLASKRAEFEQMKQHAEGYNKAVLDIFEAALAIPSPTEHRPLGVTWVKPIEGDTPYIQQVRAFSVGDTTGLPLQSIYEPLATDLGSLHIDSPNWGHNGYFAPIRRVIVDVEAPLLGDSAIGSPRTILTFNEKTYDPDKNTEPEEFDGSVRVTVDQDGKIATIERHTKYQTGWTADDLKTTKVNLDEVLKNLHSSVVTTAKTYQTDTTTE